MQTKFVMRKLLFAFFAVSLVLVSGCGDTQGSSYDRSEKPAGDWSRGLLLGESNIKQAVALETDEQRRVHLTWIEQRGEEEAESLHYMRLDQAGRVEVDKALPLDVERPRRPQLLVDEDGQVHMGLIGRSGETHELYHLLLDREGDPADLVRLSRESEEVNSFDLYKSADGEIAFVWDSEPVDEGAGIYHLVLQPGEPPSPMLLVPEGIEPFVLVDRSSPAGEALTHLTWLTRTGFSARDVYYATLRQGELTPSGGERISSFEYSESATYQAPVIGLDTENAYVMWSVQNLGGGLTPTAADTFYVSFPPGEPELLDPIAVKLPTDHRPTYNAHTGAYQYDELAPLSADVYSSDFVNAPAVVETERDELPVVVSLIIESASKEFMQLALTVFKDGEVTGYQIANETSNASVLPTLVADAESNLHLAWLDTAGFRRYKVYYATTAPEAAAWLNRTTVEDVANQAADLAWGVLSAVGFMPLTLMWNAPALVWLVVFYLFSRQEHLDELGAKIGLGVSFLVYLAVKALFLPGLLSAGTPFVYLVSQEVAGALSTIIPVAILVLALIALIIYLRRDHGGQPPALFKAYLVFALTDSILTAILYAPRFFNPRG